MAIEKMLHKDPPRNVIMDMAKLNAEDRASLEALIWRHPEWLGKVKVY